MIGLTKHEKAVLLFLLWTMLLGGGILFAKHHWPRLAPDLVISGGKAVK